MYIISKDTENAIIINKCHWEGGVMAFTLNDAGEIGSQDHAMVTKILDFIHKLEGGKVIFFQLYLKGVFSKSSGNLIVAPIFCFSS